MQGFKEALKAVLGVIGLMEMMFDVLSAWIEDFLADIDQLESDSPSDTPGSLPGSAQVSPRSLLAHSPVQSKLMLHLPFGPYLHKPGPQSSLQGRVGQTILTGDGSKGSVFKKLPNLDKLSCNALLRCVLRTKPQDARSMAGTLTCLPLRI